MNGTATRRELAQRLAGCLAGSLVLAMMVGSQEGVQDNYAFAFKQSVLAPRVLIFLGIGVLFFLAVTFWPRVVPFLARPGVWPLLSGFLAVVAAQFLMHWYDPVGAHNAYFDEGNAALAAIGAIARGEAPTPP